MHCSVCGTQFMLTTSLLFIVTSTSHFYLPFLIYSLLIYGCSQVHISVMNAVKRFSLHSMEHIIAGRRHWKNKLVSDLIFSCTTIFTDINKIHFFHERSKLHNNSKLIIKQKQNLRQSSELIVETRPAVKILSRYPSYHPINKFSSHQMIKYNI